MTQQNPQPTPQHHNNPHTDLLFIHQQSQYIHISTNTFPSHLQNLQQPPPSQPQPSCQSLNNHPSNRLSLPPEMTEEHAKFRYHYNLLVLMRQPFHHKHIEEHATISAIITTLWTILNLYLVYNSSYIPNKSQRESTLNNLILFLITIFIIHRDLARCAGQSCLPLLLLFNFTVKHLMEFIINIDIYNLSWNGNKYGGNTFLILIILLFVCQRFIFNHFGGDRNGYNVHRNLMRCHLFYRGNGIRWVTFILFAWFNALMILQLLDDVCIRDTLKANNWGNPRDGREFRDFFVHLVHFLNRGQFIACDLVVVVYCVILMKVWTELKFVDLGYVDYRLEVKGYGLWEIFVFFIVFFITWALYEYSTWMFQLIEGDMAIQFAVVIVLFVNFLMK